MRFFVSTSINALALWVATILIPAITLTPYGGEGLWQRIGSFLLVGAIFGLVNAIIAPIIKVLAFPLYILTFGLISFVINGALLLFVAWLSSQIGSDIFTIDGFTSEGLTIESMGWAILGAVIISIASLIGRWIFKILRIL
ncbi:MAG: phage holin family protein [Actinobacteria bacterium]|nr:phage holin family protein [Actinomycetota bacterium]MTA83481.1 phage holin family protein [Actinomycetota bacterium]